MVIGVNHHTAPLAMRERFWVSENRRYEILRRLSSAEGIEEIIVVSTSRRTEFLVWASEPTLAANSLLQFLGSEHGLRLTEWQHFYRLLDDAALTHIFRVASGLDSLVLGESQVGALLKAAGEQAQTVGASGPFLDATLDAALHVAQRVRDETALHQLTVPIPVAVFELSRRIFGDLEGRRVLLLGAGEMSELSARLMIGDGARSVIVIDQSPLRAAELAEKLGGTPARLGDRWKRMLDADVVISATGCPHVILTREEAERIAAERNRVALVILDLGMPRDVDPDVRGVDGILLYDVETLERTVRGDAAEQAKELAAAEKIVTADARAFRGKLKTESSLPTIIALRQRLEEICRQELESFIAERGPFTREQDQSLHAITAQVIQKIASSLARELKEVPEKEEQAHMTAVVRRLFHLGSPNTALAGTRSEKQDNERSKDKERAVAINY